ncbi:jg18997 [Pararge aegeria aegeria]|uniref:Jg18997 protein n=1 Tax=Pararge aegeria aegeria TaxID=348720 RepID=A0A8S4RDN4_9NEOP|nr:jg18997 [Pararge aegeria aegeria]
MYAEMAINYLYLPYNKTNYLAIMLVLVVLVFSLLLPDISQKLHKNSELKAVKNVLDHMQEEVKRAEVACLTANEEMGNLHHALCDEGTETKEETRNLSVNTSRGLLPTQSDPGKVEKGVGYYSRFFGFSSSPSKKEITLMSVVYTDSFDSQKKEMML